MASLSICSPSLNVPLMPSICRTPFDSPAARESADCVPRSLCVIHSVQASSTGNTIATSSSGQRHQRHQRLCATSGFVFVSVLSSEAIAD
jgi:hypothetical protein